MKLFIWSKFDPDYSDGLAFAIAENMVEAMEQVEAALGYTPSKWGPMTVHPIDKPIARAITGGN